MNEAMVILMSPELLKNIDQNRGGLSREEFIGVCLDAFLPRGADSAGDERYATMKEFEEFQHKIEKLERSFIEFLITYELELGK